MQIEDTALAEVKIIRPVRHGDARGFFSEVWNAEAMALAGLDLAFVQDNHVRNGPRGIIRGLHMQVDPDPQGKLIRCCRGAILDVAVDVRKGSATYGQHVAVELSEENWAQLWVPQGFAHGYCTLTDGAEVIYKVTGRYNPDAERGVRYDDPDIGIIWPVSGDQVVLSGKDQVLPTLREFGGV